MMQQARLRRLLIVCAAMAPFSPALAGTPDRQLPDVGEMSDIKAMMLKYVARCALDKSQRLQSPAAPPAQKDGSAPAALPADGFPGLLGLAPEWLAGTCTDGCQERVSACLLALVNRTGKHVDVSLTSAAPDLAQHLAPNANDLAYPHQEGAFFGNVWTNQTFSCRGTGAVKGPQSKRFCAAEPDTCSAGAEPFVDSGACADVCQMRCVAVAPGSRRCAAISCRDPGGHVWKRPITVLIKNQIAAANADHMTSMEITDTGLVPVGPLATATFDDVDLGPRTRAVSRLSVVLGGEMPGANLEVWLGSKKRLGGVLLTPAAPPSGRVDIRLTPAGRAGPGQVVLRVMNGARTGTIKSIELR